MSKIVGYVVSCPRIPDGRYFRTYKEAEEEMHRQMRITRASQSGIREVYEQEWNDVAIRRKNRGQGGYFRHPREHSINAIKGARKKYKR